MLYTDGKDSFELPKLTLALEERFAEARHEKDRRKSVEAKLALMTECLGRAYITERCCSADINEVDLSELDALFIDVTIAYNLNGVGEVMSAMAQLAPLVEQLERINAITGSRQGANGRQGFKRVL